MENLRPQILEQITGWDCRGVDRANHVTDAVMVIVQRLQDENAMLRDMNARANGLIEEAANELAAAKAGAST